jgi:hypothetical protein
MFGTLTLTLKGVQEKNIFVDEHGRTFHLANSWVIPPKKIKQYVLLKKNSMRTVGTVCVVYA